MWQLLLSFQTVLLPSRAVFFSSFSEDGLCRSNFFGCQFVFDCFFDVVQCFFLNTGPQRSVHLLHNSETPASVFALLEAAVSPSNPNGNKTVALVADNLFDLLMLKLSNFYQAKKQTKIESRGPRFEAGDFLVKLGSVTMGPAFKGILVEVCTPSIYLFSLSSLVSFVRYYLRIPSRPYFFHFPLKS